MNRDNRETTRHNRAYGDALRLAIDDVVGSSRPLTSEDVLNIVAARLDVCDFALKASSDDVEVKSDE